MELIDILVKAKGKIEKGWCQHHSGLDARDFPIHPTSSGARAWCAIGAIDASTDTRPDLYNKAYETLIDACEIGMGELGDWNDASSRTKEEVLAAFDKAIAKCKEPA